MCFKCGAVNHPGVNCDRIGNIEFKNYVSRNNVRRCPKCSFAIEKNGGCRHMTCSRCKYHWCWNCSGPINHSDNKRGILWKLFSIYNVNLGGSSECDGVGLEGGNLCKNISKIIFICISLPFILFFAPFIMINVQGLSCMFENVYSCC